MKKAHAIFATLLLLGLVLLWTRPAAAYEHRRGTPSVGGQIQYGTMAGDSGWQELFDRGFGARISVRQYIARNRAIGLSAEQQTFDRKDEDRTNIGANSYDASFDELQFQMLMLDYYLYFRRMYKRTPYLVFSGGFYRPQLIDQFKEVASGQTGEHVSFQHKEGFVLRAGAGAEWFLARTFSIDGALSAYYLSAPGVDGSVLTVQLALGVHLYTR